MSCNPPKIGAAEGFEGAEPVVAASIPAWDPSMHDFDQQSFVTLAASQTLFVTVVAFGVPAPGQFGILDFIGANVDNLTAWQEVEWRVRVGNMVVGPIYPANEQSFGWAPPYMMPRHEFFDWMRPVVLEARNTSATQYLVRGRLVGRTKGDPGVR